MQNLPQGLQADVAQINSIPILPTLLEVIARTTRMRFVAIARVTDQQWITCATRDEIDFGLKPGDELELTTTICNEIRQHSQPVIINEVASDSTYCQHHTPAQYGFKSYISFPIFLQEGSFFGTLCAIDPDPNQLDTPEVKGLFQSYTELISFHLQAAKEKETLSQHLKEARSLAELRDTFMGILGHDLRSPLNNISMIAEAMQQEPLTERGRKHLGLLKTTTQRIDRLVRDLLDLSVTKLGDGLSLHRQTDTRELENKLRQVVDESNELGPIQFSCTLRQPISADYDRLAQLLANLLDNALKHGVEGESVSVEVKSEDKHFLLQVSNQGNPIPEQLQARLFQPYVKRSSARNKGGMGLGLYIASEIAKAHGGILSVRSTAQEGTCFTCQLPL